jgi:hypothetical protein
MKLYVNYERLLLMIIESIETLVLNNACPGALEVSVCRAANLQGGFACPSSVVSSLGYLLLA